MAITITEGCMNYNIARNAKPCCKDVSEIDENTLVARPDGTTSTIPFHRHCQMTVCSANGYNGTGATWSTLTGTAANNINGNMGLANITKTLTSGENVQGYFTRNPNNITEDLRSILELIDKVAGHIEKSWRLNLCTKINDTTTSLSSKLIAPWTNTNPQYDFEIPNPKFEIDLTDMPGGDDYAKTYSFNTFAENTQKLDISIPKYNLDIYFGNEATEENKIKTIKNIVMDNLATVNIPVKKLSLRFNDTYIDSANVAMAENKTFDIKYDRNIIPGTTNEHYDGNQYGPYVSFNSSNHTLTIKPIWRHHIYTVGFNNTSDHNQIANISLEIDLTNYAGLSGGYTLEFEVHIQSRYQKLTIDNINQVDFINGNSVSLRNKTYLNDQNYVPAWNTCAWVFRLCSYTTSAIWSLAYMAQTGSIHNIY